MEIVNKVASSSLISFDLEEYYPFADRVLIDIKDQLFEELILREKDFRNWLNAVDWAEYEGKYVAITCSADAIVPTWAYMLLVTKLEPFAKLVVFGGLATLENEIWNQVLQKIDFSVFQDAKLVIKGCSKHEIPVYVYGELTRILRPIASSIMYGEPCSTVPLYKRK